MEDIQWHNIQMGDQPFEQHGARQVVWNWHTFYASIYFVSMCTHMSISVCNFCITMYVCLHVQPHGSGSVRRIQGEEVVV